MSSDPRVIPLSEPYLHGHEWSYVKQCLDTNWVSSAGTFVTRFEQIVAERAGARHGVAVSTGTAALHVALLLAGVEAGDEVVMPALTFIAPANAVRYVGAMPVFVDVDPHYAQIDPASLASFLADDCVSQDGTLRNRATNRRVGAILVVDLLGHPVDADAVREVARRHRLPIVEDATESLGGRYRDRPVGMLGDIGCFSFNGNKTVTAGGGGMIVTNDPESATRARYLTTQAKDDELEYIHHTVGFNYRLTNLQAALGVAQMEHLDEHLAAKRAIAAQYARAFADTPGLTMLPEAPWAWSACWLSTLRVDAPAYGEDSRALLRRLREQGIQARPLWQPLHLSPAHAGAYAVPCDVAARFYRDAISLPSSPNLSAEDQQRVVNAVRLGSRAGVVQSARTLGPSA